MVQEEPLQTELCTFWTSQTFGSGNLCFLCIMHEFGHSWTSSAYRYVRYSENIIFGVWMVFFLPGIHGEKKGDTICFMDTSTRAELCTFLTFLVSGPANTDI